MIKFFTLLNAKKTSILVMLCFISSWLIITYLLPKETKFKYEFQKGKPWLHQDLIASYDFPIFKLPDEIRREQDSIQHNFRPYFKVDEQVMKGVLNDFQNHVNAEVANYMSLTANKGYDKNKKNATINEVRELVLGNMQLIYTRGVLPILDEADVPDQFELVIMRDKFAEQLDNLSVFTQSSAYQFLTSEFDSFFYKGGYKDSSLVRFYHQLNMAKYISPNLVYDDETTQKIKETEIERLSVTKGMVQNGQIIVSRGEMVGEETFRKLYSIKKEFEEDMSSYKRYWVILGQLLLVSICLFILYQFLSTYREYMFGKLNNIVFILMSIIGSMLVTSVTLRFETMNIYLIPYIVIPILLKNFFDARVALISHIVNIMLLGFIVPNSFEFLFIQISAGYIGIFYLNNFHRRGSLTATAGIVLVVYILSYTAYSVIQEGDISSVNFNTYLWFLGNSALILISFPAIYIFEKLFGFVSELTLIELGDVNHPLLRELAEKAPGTFQHSLQVANLGESAAFKITHANPLLVRTGALYHDIGKIAMPQYFVENQISGFNPHDKHPFDESAEIIIAHVTKGVEIAKKERLPNMVIEFIKTHHGTSKAQYFYRMYQSQFPNKEVNPDKFTYPGPKPNSKETAILMMADAVEAASRSLKEISEKSISELIEKIISFQIKEDQFSEANITFKDITIIKRVFLLKLLNIYHARIEYPEEQKNKSPKESL